jgi:Shedu protein SduA, C-terminal
MCEDPDESASIPLREAAATLALTRRLIAFMDDRSGDAEALVEYLRPNQADDLALLPEVGLVEDAEGLRLHLHRLHDRLARVHPAPVAPLPPPPVTQPRDRKFPMAAVSRSGAVAFDELADGFVWWDDITAEDVASYRSVLAAADDEQPLQKHLARHPLLLVQHLHGGHGRWVLSKKRLGSQYVTDFVIGQRSSSGFEWQFVELQSPQARLFVESTGRQSKQLDEGLRQINEWRRWLADNRDYARRSRSHNGLGLVDVSADDPGLVLIGRDAHLTALDRERRRQLDTQLHIRIRTYDWLVREAEARLGDLNRSVEEPR